MSYTPSAPARHAANVLSKNFELEPIKDLAASQHNIAALIDAITGIGSLETAVKWFIKENPWWDRGVQDDITSFLIQNKPVPRLEENLEKLRDSVRAIEQLSEKTYASSQPNSQIPREGSIVAANKLIEYFKFSRRPKSRVNLTLRNIALLIEVSTNLFRVQDALDAVLRTDWEDKHEALRQLDRIREAIRVLELSKNRLPNELPSNNRFVVVKVDREMPKQLPADFKDFKTKLESAVTVEQEQQILQSWRNHRTRS